MLSADSKYCIYRSYLRSGPEHERWHDDVRGCVVIVTKERSGYMVWDSSIDYGNVTGSIVHYDPYSRDRAIEWAVDYARERLAKLQVEWALEKLAFDAENKALEERVA